MEAQREPTAEERAILEAGGVTNLDFGLGDSHATEPPLQPQLELPVMRAALGDERVDAFARTLLPERASAPSEDERVGDREALAARLEQAGLSPEEAKPVVDDAEWAIVLEPGGRGVTRLAGLPVLAHDVSWPMAGSRPLTHLATVALDELPAVPGRDVLPAGGHLSFFADLSEAGAFYEPVEPGGPGRELVAVLHAAPGVETHQPDPPDCPPRDE